MELLNLDKTKTKKQNLTSRREVDLGNAQMNEDGEGSEVTPGLAPNRRLVRRQQANLEVALGRCVIV